MNNAKGIYRFISFVSDISILIGLYYLSLKITEVIVPAKNLYPPVGAMQLYSPRDFHIYLISSLLGAFFYSTYNLVCYFAMERTLGQVLTRIKRVNLDNTQLTQEEKVKVTLWGLLKYLMIFTPAPLVAFIGIFGFAASILILVVPILYLLINPLLCYFTDEKRSWFELRTKTKIIYIGLDNHPI